MCKICISREAAKTDEELINKLILNQRGMAFTENEIVRLAARAGVSDAEQVRKTLVRLGQKGLVVRASNRYLVRSVGGHRKMTKASS
jgi:DNA-binding GntR family transcriptional regulator